MKVKRKTGFKQAVQFTALLLAVFILSACGNITGMTAGFSGVTDYSSGLSINWSIGLVTLDHDDNLLVNSGFDNDSGWAACDHSNGVYFGDSSLSLSGPACAYQTVPAIAGDDYTLTCNASTVGYYAEASLVMLDANFNMIDEQVVEIDSSKAVDKSSFLTAPAGTVYAAATLYSGGQAIFNECILSNTTDPEPPVTPPVTPVTPPASGELLVNPGFDGNTAWTNCGNVHAYDISGSSLNINGTACVFQTVEAVPGATYTLTCDSASNVDYSNISLNMLNSNFMTMVSDVAPIGNNLKEATVSRLTAPSGTSYVGVTIYSEGPAIHENCSLVADVSAPTPTPTPVPTPTPNPVPSGNLLSNPSFDTFDDWFTCSNTPITNYGIGTGAFNAGATACAFQTLEVIPGANYNLTCAGQSDAVTSNISLSLLDSSYNTVAVDTTAINSALPQTFSTSVAANSGASFVSVTLYSDSGSTLIFDCNLTSDVAGPAPTPAPTPAPAPTPTPAPTNTILLNPSFDGVDSWTTCAGANQGNYGIGTGNWSANGTACAFQTVSVIPNVEYTLACSGQTSALTSNISLSMLDSNYNIITQQSSAIVSGSTSTVVMPSGSNSSFVSVTLYNTDGSTQISDCSLTSK